MYPILNRFALMGLVVGAGLLLGGATVAFAESDPVPLPCDPADCGPVPIELPGCPTCTKEPAPDPN
jgi:hypothetical protein